MHQGLTFFDVDLPVKTAVDPLFRFDVAAHASGTCEFHQVRSDEYFAKLGSDVRFDLVFIDGLHTFAQTLRDFCATLTHAHTETLWLIDDTMPNSWLASIPNLQRVRRIRRLLRSKTGAWMGDVHKVVMAIHDFFPQLSYATFPNRGQTVVWHQPRQDFQPTWNSLSRIESLSYRQSLRLRDTHMNIMPGEALFKRVQQARDWGAAKPT